MSHMLLLNQKNKTLVLTIILIVFLSIPAIAALFSPGFFESDDGEWMVIRFSSFYQSFRDGQFPVRFLGRLNQEYGYPVANFLYPGFMYVGIPIKAIGFGFVDTIKVILGFSLVISAVFTYLWLSKIFGRVEAIFGSLFYLYAPYHLFDVYKRGSVGEVLALAVVPFILWQIERGSLLWVSLGISFLILSHNTLALLFLPIVVMYMILSFFMSKSAVRKKFFYSYCGMIFLGIGISSFFSFPAIIDLQHTIFHQTKVSEWTQYFSSLNLVGLSTIGIVILTIGSFVFKFAKVSKHRFTVFFLILSIISLFMSFSVSSPVWDKLSVAVIQFPFRFLSVTILSAAFLSAFLISIIPSKYKVHFGIIIIAITLLFSIQFMFPKEFVNKGEGFYTTNMDTTTVKNEYMPKWVKIIPTELRKEKIAVSEGRVINFISTTKKVSFQLDSEKASLITFSTVYFPGWSAKVDGQQADIKIEKKRGVMQLDVPFGTHRVELDFKETPIRLMSDFLTVLSLCILFILTLKKINLLKV